MNFIQNKVHNMPLQDMVQLTKDYELFEKQGSVGDCLLRETTEKLISESGLSEGSTALWMDRVAFEAYRYLAQVFLMEMVFMGCGTRNKYHNLKVAIDAMVKVVKVWSEKNEI